MLMSNFNQFHKQFSENLPRSLERTISLLDEIENPQNKIMAHGKANPASVRSFFYSSVACQHCGHEGF